MLCPTQDQRQAWMLLAHDAGRTVEIGYGAIPAVGIPENAQLRAAARQTVSTMIGRVDGVARRVQSLGHACVARSMLGRAVGDQNGRARVLPRPDPHEDRHLVRRIGGEADYLHLWVFRYR